MFSLMLGLRSNFVQRNPDDHAKSIPGGNVAYAHTRNDQGKRHDLVEHLLDVAKLCSRSAAPFGASRLAYYLGLWHDTGKFDPRFQNYLLEAEAGRRRRGPDHKAAGVQIALGQNLGPLALLLQGHHGGLKNKQDLKRWLKKHAAATSTALGLAEEFIPDLLPDSPLGFPEHIASESEREFFLRMLFSALVDADFLDTERHFSADQSGYRGSGITLNDLWTRFQESQRQFDGVPDTLVNRHRRQIYKACIEAATLPPGLFRLTVPTGGGKTRSGMGFALRHALEHGQRRIVVVVPFITITQQTASVYREIFSAPNDTVPAVLEHHSGTPESREEPEVYSPRANWARLNAENWNAPIIVTTTVQLFESLFANNTSRCRKLHRLAESIIILDEAQSLPAQLLDPILDGLRELCTNYGSTVVLSTATQPAFDAIPIFTELDAHEIVPEPEQHFQALKRVAYTWRLDEPSSWEEAASLMRQESQALAILNTKKDALALLDALDDPTALHLSTLLCGAHRARVIEDVTRRLAEGEPCRLVATQVVEAGVDLDFPLVLRALGPLDSIIQAAGRANREGELDVGRVIVFEPAEGGLPPGTYQRATETTRTQMNTGVLDMNDPTSIHDYFTSLYQLEDTDRKDIQKKRRELDYPEVARRFRMIDDDTVNVVIIEYGTREERQHVRSILAALRAGAPPTRERLRQLQPYTVSLWRGKALEHQKQGFLSTDEVAPDLWEWLGRYDDVRGLSASDIEADQFVF
jgi:CRISPR-associated endonuclease/helicase Cas3